MSAPDVLAVQVMAADAVAAEEWRMAYGGDHSAREAMKASREARAAVADALAALRGCRDMLRESAKQHRLCDDAGHARHCDTLADTADAALARMGEGK